MAGVRLRKARVEWVRDESPDRQVAGVRVEGRVEPAINYPCLTGAVVVGDEVVVNTTAVELRLGTGGFHLVVSARGITELAGPGHAMKARYTPLQLACQAVEEPGAPGHQVLRRRWRLGGMPVVVAELHSQLPVVLSGLRARYRRLRLGYVMTDGGALPLAFGRLVGTLRARGLVDVVITAGQAFGGDLEAVNVYSALAAARHVAGCDAVVVCMGPGQLGTGTRLGFSGVEQADNLNRAAALGGLPIAVLRLSGADPRPRHRGVSHHTLTVLGRLALARCLVAVPAELARELALWWRLVRAGVVARHAVVQVPGTPGVEYLRRAGVEVTTMGRGPDQDPDFFLAAGAAGWLAGGLAAAGRRAARYSARHPGPTRDR